MRVLLYGFNDNYYFEIAKKFVEKGIVIDQLITYNPSQYKQESQFNTTTLVDQKIFSDPKLVRKLNRNNPQALSEKVINEFAKTESLFLSITDRLAYRPPSVRFRKEMYLELLLYWLYYLKKNAVTTVCFNHTPHMGESNVIYAVAKKYGIKTLVVAPTLIENQVLIQEDYLDHTKIPQVYLLNLTKAQVITNLGEKYYRNATKGSQWLDRSREINTEVVRNEQNNLFMRIIKRNAKNFSVQKLVKLPSELLSLSLNSIFFLNKPTKKITEYFLTFDFLLHSKSLTKYYDTIAQKPSLGAKFVYFSLHVQPERTTMPEGGIFFNQLLALDILAKSIPEDMLIYVKDHPRQFDPTDIRLRHFRDKHFYEKIVEYKNVILIDRSLPSKDLITNAHFIATITGSVGWESLVTNKCCLVFGNPWYASCNSCYVVKSKPDCQRAVKSILTKEKKQVELDVVRFLHFFKSKAITSAHFHNLAIRSELDYQLLVKNLADGLMKHFV